jgi:hypothetical protein
MQTPTFSCGSSIKPIRDAGLAFGGFFFGTQRFDFSLSLIDRASALYRIGSGLGLDAAGRGKRYPVGEVAALARAKQGARYPLHAAVEQPTDSPGAVAAERGGYLVYLLEPSRWQANANHRVPPGPRPTTFSTAFFHRILVNQKFPHWQRENVPPLQKCNRLFGGLGRATPEASAASNSTSAIASPARTRWRWRAWR